MLLAITFLPVSIALAGVTDYIKSTNAYKTITNYTAPAYNYITTSRPYNYVAGSAASAYNTLGNIKAGIVDSVRGQVSNLSNTAGKYIGLGAKSALIRPDFSKMFEANLNPENEGRVLVYRKMESRIEYSVTDKRTNKTIPINESVFRSLVKNNRPKID